MKLHKHNKKWVILILLLSVLENSCSDAPVITNQINETYYYTQQERGAAFSNMVFDLEFYKKRKFWTDKLIGDITIRSEQRVDSIKISFDNMSKLNRIILKQDSSIILDTSLDLDKEFDIDFTPKNN
jgi:hypothetical protein